MTLTAETLRGVNVAIVTPFQDNQDVDLSGAKQLTRFLIDAGVHGIMTTGGNGEFPHMMPDEKKAVTAAIVEEAAGAIPIIGGTAAAGTREAVLLAQDAKDVGADGLIVTAPYYFQVSEDALFAHYETIATEVDLPLVLYNNPLYTGNHITPALIDRLAAVPNVIGLKQSDADFGILMENIRTNGDKVAVLTGIDSQFYAALASGATGIFSTAACVIPREMVAIFDLVQSQSFEEARRLQLRLQALNRYLEYDPGYVGPCKAALRMLGLPAGPVRGPLPEVTPEEEAGVRAGLAELGLLS
jgi:4-hydroxy-tetrahydrodipicolinate synthase